MKITSNVYFIETEHGDYIRLGKDNWLSSFGESYEYLYDDKKVSDLEEKFAISSVLHEIPALTPGMAGKSFKMIDQ